MRPIRSVRPVRPVRLLISLTAAVLLSPAVSPALAQSSSQDVPATPPAAVTPAAAPALSRDAALRRGRQLVAWFYAQNLEPVWAAFQPEARANFGDDLKLFQAYRASGASTYGSEMQVLAENVQEQDGVLYYLRTALFERGPRVQWTVAFGLDAVGRVVSFGILGGSEPAPDQQALLGAGR